MTTSVRDSLNAEGQSASIKQLAQQRNELFPLSLRKFCGALPPGRILRKVISLNLLQQKFDQFFNNRSRPLFQFRFNGKDFGASTLTVAFDDPVKGYDHEHPFVSQDLAGPGEVLEFPGIIFGTHRYHFNDVNSDGLTLNVVPGSPAGVEIVVHFETEGPTEIDAEGFPDIDFDGFNIKFKLDFGSDDNALDLLGFVDDVDSTMATMVFVPSGDFVKITWVFRGVESHQVTPSQSIRSTVELIKSLLIKQFVNTDVSVNVGAGVPDGVVANSFEGTMNKKIFEAMKTEGVRDALKKILTRWLVGGDFYVTSVFSDNDTLTIDYILPPGQVEPFPENPQPPLDPGLLANIEHIVVLMMENRSFDHMLGYLSKEGNRPDVDGLHGGEKNRYKGTDYPSFALSDTRFDESPCHDNACVENQINGGNLDGFVADFAKKYESQGVSPGRVMGYHNADHVPVYDGLAKNFLICQRWFAAHPGPTFCNRYYTLTGRLNRDLQGRWEFDNPASLDLVPVSTKTIFDHLTEQGVSWNYYERGYCFLRLFSQYTFDTTHIVDAGIDSSNFVANALAGALPKVTFIDPDFIDLPPGYDDGAPANIARGQHFVGTVVNALKKSPLWSKTLLVITYDEHGGFYDHVNPLQHSENAKPVSAIDHYGVRVPAFVVSPWVDGPKVSDLVFDHTSIAKTIARRFLSARPPDMGERMAAANDLSMVLSTTMRRDIPDIVIPPDPTPDLALAGRGELVIEDDDFKMLLKTMRARFPIRR